MYLVHQIFVQLLTFNATIYLFFLHTITMCKAR